MNAHLLSLLFRLFASLALPAPTLARHLSSAEGSDEADDRRPRADSSRAAEAIAGPSVSSASGSAPELSAAASPSSAPVPNLAALIPTDWRPNLPGPWSRALLAAEPDFADGYLHVTSRLLPLIRLRRRPLPLRCHGAAVRFRLGPLPCSPALARLWLIHHRVTLLGRRYHPNPTRGYRAYARAALLLRRRFAPCFTVFTAILSRFAAAVIPTQPSRGPPQFRSQLSRRGFAGWHFA